MKYVIDPYLFSFHEKMTEEELESYIEQFLVLEKWWVEHREDIYVLDDTGRLLWEGGYYPMVEKLKPLLDKYDTEIDYHDVSRTMTHYLQQTQLLDDVCNDKLIGKQGGTLEKHSMAKLQDRPLPFQESMKELMWHILRINIAPKKKDTKEYALFTRGVDGELKANFNYESLSDDADNYRLEKETKECTVNCHSSVSAFLHHKDTPFLVFKYQQGKDDLYLGIRCKVMQDGKMEALDDVEEQFVISLQDSFYEDFCTNDYSDKPSDIRSTLDSISKAVFEVRHGKEHHIRTGKGGNDPYLFHGGYAAMRKDVTTSIKLHFWKKPPHFIFAKIGEHDFFKIPWEDK